MEDENNGNKKRTKLDIALIVCMSLCVACNVVQIVLRIIEIAR